MNRIKSFLLGVLFCGIAQAQHENTMFFMDRLPQSNYLNPALHPPCTFYLGGFIVPLVGQIPPPIHISAGVPLDFNDVIYQGDKEYYDQQVHPFHPSQTQEDRDAFFNKLNDINYINTSFQFNLLTFGFAAKQNFWTFDISHRLNSSLGFPKTFLELPYYGNGEVMQADLTGFSFEWDQYNEFAVGFAQNSDGHVTYALKLKYLNGLFNVNTVSNEIQIITDSTSFEIDTKSDFVVNINAPIEFELDEVNKKIVDFSLPEFDLDYIQENFLFTNNHGVAFDLGFKNDINSELSIYGSLIDFGFIQWQSNPQTVKLSGEFAYDGIELASLNMDSLLSLPSLDSILGSYILEHKKEVYISQMPYKIYGGLNYKFSKYLNVGGLYRAEKASNSFKHSFTGSANFRPFRYGALSLSISYINKTFHNYGAGFTLRLGAIQTYFVFDNYSLALGDEDTRFISWRMGTNLIFGRGKKKDKDKPLLWTL